MGRLKSISQVTHLDGLSDIHFIDVASNRKRLHPEAVGADLAEQKIIEAMMADNDLKGLRALIPQKFVDLEENLKDAALTEAYFRGLGDRPDLVSTFWFGNAGAGQVSLVDGHPGHAVRIPGPQWERLVMAADDERHEWKDDKGKVRKSPALHEARRVARAEGKDPDKAVPLEMSGQLKKLYARLPPWFGKAAGKDLSTEDLDGLADEIGLKFEAETGKRVLAISFHRETGYDLHVHIIFTDIVEAVRETEAPGKDYVKKLLTDQRKVVRARLVDDGVPKPSRLQIQAKLDAMWESGKLQNPSKPKTQRFYFREALPAGARKSLVTMGPAYVSKTNLWEASGRSPEVAAVNEQSDHNFTFKARVIDAAKREIGPHCSDGPESVYIDCWLSKTWTKAVTARLTDEGKGRALEEAKASVARYVATGRSLPAPFTKKERDIRKKKEAEIEAMTSEVTARELAVSVTEAKVERRAWEKVWGAFTGIKPAPGKSAKDVEDAIKSAVENLRKKTIAGALGDVFSLLLPGRKLVNESEVGIRKELFVGVIQELADGYTGVLGALFPGRKSQEKSIRGLKSELETAVVEFKAAAVVEAVETVLGDRLEIIRSRGQDPVAELSAELRRLQESELLLRGILKVEIPTQGPGAKFKAAVVKLLTKHDKARGMGTKVKLEKSPKKQDDNPGGVA